MALSRPGRSFVPSSLLLPLVTAALCGSLWAHDNASFMAARQSRVPANVIVDPAGGSLEFASSGISLVGWLPLGNFGSPTTGNDSWGYTSPSGREYAIIGLSDSIAFVEVTDPGAPVIVQQFAAVGSLWRDVKVYEDHAYWVSEGGDGIVVGDMSLIDSGIVTLVGSFGGTGTSASHNVAIDEDSGYLYRTGGGSDPIEGLRIYSLANKAAPVEVAVWDDRYVHDAQVVTYTSGPFAGKQVAFCYSEEGAGGGSPGIDILDVTNKNNIQPISLVTYSNPVFSHQGWLSPDRNHLYLNDELDEIFTGSLTTTRIVDVSNLNAPVQVGSFTTGLPTVDHNLYTLGNLIFEANYRSGLRVFDASNPTAPVETAWFDTYPDDDGVDTNGLWNVYPYLPSGTIIGSDLEKGLFLWRLGDPELAFTLTGGLQALVSPAGEPVEVTITPRAGFALQPGSATLHVDTGSGFTTQALTDVGGGVFQGSFPSLDCEDTFDWYVSARTTDDVTWTLPEAAPSFLYQARAATGVTLVAEEDMESDPGWIVGLPGDDATTGIWTRVDPIGTEAQPENDHTADPGSQCWVTGQGVFGGGLGDNDVDGGKTSLSTDDIDLSGGDATISYWRWYNNATSGSPNADIFEIDISDDGGSSWTNVETVGPAGPETLGGWFKHSLLVSDFVTPTDEVRLRFVASDEGDGSIVEAAIDDLTVERFECGSCQVDLGFGGPGTAVFSICGDTLDSGNFAEFSVTGGVPGAFSLLFLGLSNAPTSFKGGTLVPVPPLVSLGLTLDGTGSVIFPLPGGGGPATLFAQLAFQDGSQTQGVGLTNALQVELGP